MAETRYPQHEELNAERDKQRLAERDEAARSYEAVARKYLRASLNTLDPAQHEAEVAKVTIDGGHDGAPFRLIVPGRLDPYERLGVPKNGSSLFTFFDGRDLRRVLLTLVLDSRERFDRHVVENRATMARVEAMSEAIARSAAELEAWDGY